MNARQRLLSVLVGLSALPLLQSCGVTQYHRDEDAKLVLYQALTQPIDVSSAYKEYK